MTLHASITNLAPSKLWVLRYVCRLIGATIVVCKAKPRRIRERDAADPGSN